MAGFEADLGRRPPVCRLTKQANRRPAARAKPRMRDVRVERRVRPHLPPHNGAASEPGSQRLAASRKLVCRYSGPNELLQSPFFNLCAFVEVDCASEISFETRIKEARGIT